MAKTKSGGSSRLGRESRSQRLGIKAYAGEKVKAGMIIVRQRGSKFVPGKNTEIGKDDTNKAADTTLLEIRLAMALGGKAFATLTGDVASVQAAVDAGRAVIAQAGLLVNAVVIPRPHPDVYRELI